MASRYPSTRSLSFCFHPKVITINSIKYQISCGKCNGCLLHKANEWSMRLGNDLENNRNSIFFTLTYNNKYLPKAIFDKSDGMQSSFLTKNDYNVRFDGTKEVQRKETFETIISKSPTDIQNLYPQDGNTFVNYLSKRDIQLYLKLIRKDLDLQFYETDNRFRYFIIGEYGPTTFRPHYHCVVSPVSHEVSEYLLEFGLFKSWQMCDKTLFDQYAHYCDSGARGYVTQYLTSYSNLSAIYKEKEIRPFRLASKSASTGCTTFDKKEVFENVLFGNIEYTKPVARLGQQFVLVYPSYFMRTLFPKVFGYSELSFDGLLCIYSSLHTVRRKFPGQCNKVGAWSVLNRLHPDYGSHPSTVNAISVATKFCDTYGVPMHTYLTAMDMYYYKVAMLTLREWYLRQDLSRPIDFLREYINIGDYITKYRLNALSEYETKVFRLFLDSCCLTLSDIDCLSSCEVANILKPRQDLRYQSEVDDIVSQMEKMPKYNELTGNSPHIV